MDSARISEYRATARRLRVWLAIPIILAVLLAAWSVLGAARSYESTATLWVDNAAPLGSSLDAANLSATPPSTQEQTFLDELLATPSFVLAVGARSSLESYVVSHSSSGWSPSALLSKVTGHSGSIEDRVEATLGSGVGTFVSGPQVLQVSFTGPSPAVVTSTLSALLGQLQSATTHYGEQYGQTEVSYSHSQVTAATQALSVAREQAQQYLQSHPGATAANNANYAALLSAQTAAANQLTQATTSLHEAAVQAETGAGTGVTMHVTDAASPPAVSGGGKKHDLMAVVGGVFAGLVVDLLLIIVLTPGGLGKWEPEEADHLDVVQRFGAAARDRDDASVSSSAPMRIPRPGVSASKSSPPDSAATTPALRASHRRPNR